MPDDSVRKWCANCRRAYAGKLASLGNSKRKPTPSDPPEVVETQPLNRLLELAARGGQLKEQALATRNKWKWRQFYSNEARLQKEMSKWQLIPRT